MGYDNYTFNKINTTRTKLRAEQGKNFTSLGNHHSIYVVQFVPALPNWLITHIINTFHKGKCHLICCTIHSFIHSLEDTGWSFQRSLVPVLSMQLHFVYKKASIKTVAQR